MTHEIICLSNPYLALSSCGDVRNVFLLSHHGTGWRHQAADLLTEWASLLWSMWPLQWSLWPLSAASATLSKRTVQFHIKPKPHKSCKWIPEHSPSPPEIFKDSSWLWSCTWIPPNCFSGFPWCFLPPMPARTHARAHARAHAHTHTPTLPTLPPDLFPFWICLFCVWMFDCVYVPCADLEPTEFRRGYWVPRDRS